MSTTDLTDDTTPSPPLPTQVIQALQYDADPIEYASSMTSTYQQDEIDDDMDIDLAKPEFNGLWDKQPVKQEIDPLFNRSKHWKTKMDKINENLQGEIKFLAQTGMFTVPIRCEIKKVELSLDKTTVNLGSTVVDEHLYQSITLRNTGALGTNYRLVKASVLQTEQNKAQTIENLIPKPKPESTSSLEKETSTMSDGTDIANGEYIDVFTIKADPIGFLAPHSTMTFSIEFSAPMAGGFHEEYTLVFDKNVPQLHFSVTAQSLDVPVWIENPSMDFKICMFDRLYQDALILRNRSSAALRVSVDIQPRALQNHIEIVPRTAYIQAKSSFNLQVKLTAHPSIFDDGLSNEIFDSQLNTFIVPLEVKVADQIRTVPFSISAILTTSDLQFDVEQIDFGCCTTTESVLAKVQLKNNSLLAQPFGFVNLPD
ncbi:unnamed protein product, partial [Rotaria magnacalcarata]